MSERIVVEIPVGPLTISADEGAIVSVRFGDWGETGRSEILERAKVEILEYFSGRRKRFTLPVNPQGTEYQKKVWRSLMEIPYGDIRTYSWVSEIAGGSPRSAGNALGANPIPIIIPCHRVLRKDGSIGGYSSGVEIKRYLLELERLHLNESVLK